MVLRPLLLIGLLFAVAQAAENGECAQNMMKCKNGKCIPEIWRCDNDNDCGDGTDEEHCDPTKDQPKCNSIEYQCPVHEVNGLATRATCIPLSWVCDGEPDCAGREDERNCSVVTCKPGTFSCPSFGVEGAVTCVPDSWKCDGQTDCHDGIDEKGCDERKCGEDQFQCKDKSCITKKWMCDHDQDCLDGSDEDSELCKNANKTCDPGKIPCESNGFCIPEAWRCDGERDCLDSTDEKNCTTHHAAIPVNCSAGYFKCKTGNQCIKEEWKCDGDFDCHDYSDEQDCKKEDHCKEGMFLCDLGICRNNNLKCDGKDDCFDGTDEVGCPPKSISTACNVTQYVCPGGSQCIDHDKFCSNKKEDCISATVCGDDTKTQICEKGSLNCKCRMGYMHKEVCHCPPGHELKVGDSGKHHCEDINECHIVGTCDQECLNLPGTYECRCKHGYRLVRHGEVGLTNGNINPPSKCKANGSDPLLLLSNRVTIRQYDLVTRAYHALVTKLDSAVAMDYWHKENTLIWSDVAKEKIMICHFGKDKNIQTESLDSIKDCKGRGDGDLISDVVTPDGLAVDWVHGLLFWTDTGINQINVMNLTTKHRRTIVDTDLDEPRAIAVDPSAGVIFWTDWGKSRIERSGMDGNNRKTIVSSPAVKWPNGLTLDIIEKRLYWVDAKMKMISSSDYDGKHIRVVLKDHSKVKHPFSLTVFEERLFWTDWDQDGVLSTNKFKGDKVNTFMSGVHGPMTVRVYHEVVQPSFENKCDYNECDELCLPSSRIEKELHNTKPFSCACHRENTMHKGRCLNTAALNALEQKSGYSRSMVIFAMLIIVSGVVLVGYRFYRRPANR
ncbi:hypothetical protein L596_002303 [Steinernema carpocapsae]|uniref:Very low-density lipoprotein receptor n=1 Tax=Steinernema carpocapsae TaxID=34508 RepID=A0A4U8UP47_STECR|nr:hypothetical protein L596_002303 [Steinernema carpocapsae]